MKPTLEQLTMLSDYELNCAVAEKKGLPVRKRISKDGNSVYTDDLKGTGCFVDYCNTPNDYMPIAIEHGISPVSYKQADSMMAYLNNGQTAIGRAYPLLPELVGKMLMIAFLLMEKK